MSVEGESAALVFLSITVALCRTRGERGFGMFVDICRIVSVERVRGFSVFVDICRIVSVEGESADPARLSSAAKGLCAVQT